ncbi:MAG: hypothetical protein IKC53_01245 [Lentisphaeria bacterium]|nr:hypothetical protein [Lentisphaeria bacterium]
MAAKKGCFSRLLKVFLVLLAVLIILLITLFFLATGAPVSYPAPKFDGGDTGVIAGVITRLARSLVDKEGRVVETAVLKLSRSEVQTLLNAEIAKSVRADTRALPYAVVWDAGRLQLHYSMPLSSGRAVNVSVEVSPVVDEGDLTLIPGQGAIGKVPMPRAALNYAAKKLELMATGDDSTRTALSAFKRIEPGEDGTLLLMFDPRDVNTVIRILRSAGEPQSREELDRDADEDADKNSGEIEE